MELSHKYTQPLHDTDIAEMTVNHSIGKVLTIRNRCKFTVLIPLYTFPVNPGPGHRPNTRAQAMIRSSLPEIVSIHSLPFPDSSLPQSSISPSNCTISSEITVI